MRTLSFNPILHLVLDSVMVKLGKGEKVAQDVEREEFADSTALHSSSKQHMLLVE